MADLTGKELPEQLAFADFDRLFSLYPISELRGRRLFITGGTGFFGFWLLMAISYLNSTGANITVTALSRNAQRFLERHPFFKQCQWLSFCHGNIIDYSPPSGHFDLFIHAATDTSPSAIESSLQLFNSMVSGTQHLLAHARSSNAKRVLLISSGAVYGEQPQQVDKIPEDASYAGSSIDVNNVYSEGKRAMEMLCACYAHAHNIEIVTARCFSFIGYGLPSHLAIGQLINDALYADVITIKGDGLPVRSYLYAADLAVWLLAILTKGENMSAYNVGSDVGMTIADYALLVKAILAPEKIIKIEGNVQKASQARTVYVPDIGKAVKGLGLKVWTPLSHSIEGHRI